MFSSATLTPLTLKLIWDTNTRDAALVPPRDRNIFVELLVDKVLTAWTEQKDAVVECCEAFLLFFSKPE